MKELSIEEKAKRYDEALKQIKECTPDENGFITIYPQEIFPELVESEDERIRKGLIQYFSTFSLDTFAGLEPKKIIAWLEKQGEHKKFRDGIQIGDKVTRNRDGVLVNLSQLKRVAKKDEKQGEQKPADNVEPDILIEESYQQQADDLIDMVTENSAWSEEEIEKAAQKWDSKASFTPFHMTLDGNGSPNEVIQDITTHKESFKAGINWILKSLKDRVLPQPKQEWSKEDEHWRQKAIDFMKHPDLIKATPTLAKNTIEWLKSLKVRVQPKQEWSEEDEESILEICNYLDRIVREDEGNQATQLCVQELKDWLDSLKDRVQPKVKLTQLDKNILEAAIAFVEQNNHFNCWSGVDKQTVLSALRSLRPQNRWKPSDLPHWKKSTLPNDNTTGFNSDYFCHKGYIINYKELFEKLPKDN